MVNGQPVAGALVYIPDLGAALTDQNGFFSFQGATAGVSYQLFVRKSGVQFPEGTLAISTDEPVQVSGTAVSFNPRGCTENDISNSLFQGTDIAAELRRLALDAASNLAVRRRTASERRLQRQLNSYINVSRNIPDVVLTCSGIPGCTAENLRGFTSNLLKRLNDLRREGLFVNRTLRVGRRRTASAARSFRRTVIRTNSAAKATVRGLPKKTDSCQI